MALQSGQMCTSCAAVRRSLPCGASGGAVNEDGGSRTMGVYTQSQGNWLSRRGAFLVALIAFHVMFVWALKSGLAVKLHGADHAAIKAEIINEVIEDAATATA